MRRKRLGLRWNEILKMTSDLQTKTKFYKLPIDIASRRDLPAGTKIILAVIADRIGENDSCWPGSRTLANDTGLSRLTVLEGIKKLETKGIIQVERQPNGKVNHYRLVTKSGKETIPVKKLYRYRNYTAGGIETIPQAVKKLYHNQIDQLNQTNTLRQNSNEFRLAELLLNLILERKSDFKKPNLQTWVIHIERMIRLDKRTPERIEAVMRWCQQDSFWQNNILSTAKLREKFDQLELKMTKGNQNGDRNSKVGTSGARPNPTARPGEFVR